MRSILCSIFLLCFIFTGSGQVRQIKSKIKVGEKGKFNKLYKGKVYSITPPDLTDFASDKPIKINEQVVSSSHIT